MWCLCPSPARPPAELTSALFSGLNRPKSEMMNQFSLKSQLKTRPKQHIEHSNTTMPHCYWSCLRPWWDTGGPLVYAWLVLPWGYSIQLYKNRAKHWLHFDGPQPVLQWDIRLWPQFGLSSSQRSVISPAWASNWADEECDTSLLFSAHTNSSGLQPRLNDGINLVVRSNL